MTIAEFQSLIEALYFERDAGRGLERTFFWFIEEVGELARALHRESRGELQEEFADVFAWLVTLASLVGVDLDQAVNKYTHGCPKCRACPCRCPAECDP
jgi:NTP pyrophosphatase (non-canonical NTP hydrolase)